MGALSLQFLGVTAQILGPKLSHFVHGQQHHVLQAFVAALLLHVARDRRFLRSAGLFAPGHNPGENGVS